MMPAAPGRLLYQGPAYVPAPVHAAEYDGGFWSKSSTCRRRTWRP